MEENNKLQELNDDTIENVVGGAAVANKTIRETINNIETKYPNVPLHIKNHIIAALRGGGFESGWKEGCKITRPGSSGRKMLIMEIPIQYQN